jgi:hypothetical protein
METVCRPSGHVLAYVLSQDAIDERLVSHLPALGFLSEANEHVWVQADCDEAPVAFAEWGATHTSHHSQLFARRLCNFREVNWPNSGGTFPVLCGSRVSR